MHVRELGCNTMQAHLLLHIRLCLATLRLKSKMVTALAAVGRLQVVPAVQSIKKQAAYEAAS